MGHCERGFTALEVMVVLVITATMAFAALPVIVNVVEATKAKSAADQVVSALNLARFYAVSNGAQYTVTVNANRITTACTDANCPPGAPTEPATPIVTGAQATDGTFVFTPLGTSLSATTVTVSYTGAPAPWQVRADLGGRIRACKGSCS